MLIQVFSQYYQLAKQGKVEYLACPMHESDKPAIFALVHSLDDKTQKIMLDCIACGYKNAAGLTLYQNIIDKIRKVTLNE